MALKGRSSWILDQLTKLPTAIASMASRLLSLPVATLLS
jgi:hypothetical protein